MIESPAEREERRLDMFRAAALAGLLANPKQNDTAARVAQAAEVVARAMLAAASLAAAPADPHAPDAPLGPDDAGAHPVRPRGGS